MSVLLRDNGKKYVMDWNSTSDDLKVMEFDIGAYNQAAGQYDYTLVTTHTFSSGSFTPIYGSWYDDATQTATVNTPTKMILGHGSGNGITKISNTDFEVSESGTYNIQFSAQLDQSSGAPHHIYIWLRKNGTDVPWSASEVAIQGSLAETVAAWNWFESMNAGDEISIMYYFDNANVQIKAVAPTALKPGIPSVILTMNKIANV
jgi:hypothetical protein